ncbi:hypothetical protein QR685DRAFT_444618, partial [Neurospora intermedia]
LYINANYFQNKSTTFKIIIGRLVSKAAENIFPFIYKFKNYTLRLIIVSELFDYLKESYLDYNSKEKANVEFEKLVIRDSNRF